MTPQLPTCVQRFALKRLSLAGLQWSGSCAGEAPVLCLHGWLDNAASFQVMGPLLAANRTVTSVDLPGHGFSDHRPPGYAYNLLDYVQDLADLVETLPEPVHIVGHSLGGIIAALFAATAPRKLISLSLIDSLGPYVARPEDFPVRLAKGVGKALARERKTMPVYETVEAAETARQSGTLPLSPFAASQLVPRNLRPVEGGWSWRTDPLLRNPSLSALTEEQVLACLKAIARPVLLLQAESGLLASDRRFEKRLAAVKDMTHERVPGSHHCHLDGDVAALARTINRFLQGCDPVS